MRLGRERRWQSELRGRGSRPGRAGLEVCRGGSDHSRASTPSTVRLQRSDAEERIRLEPVEAVTIATLVDLDLALARVDGPFRRVGPADVAVLLYPDFWTRRRVTIPGREPFKYRTTSRGALTEARFDILVRQQPSFLYDQAVLVTADSTAPPTSKRAHGLTGTTTPREVGIRSTRLVTSGVVVRAHSTGWRATGASPLACPGRLSKNLGTRIAFEAQVSATAGVARDPGLHGRPRGRAQDG